MTPRHRTPQLRDQRFSRVRRLTRTVVVSSGVASGLFVGYAANTARPLTVTPSPAATTPSVAGATTTTAPGPASSPVPTPAPVTTTTTCYTTPSGTVTCL
ncbi:MAG: hypothetical protein ACP5PB_01020 [Acidimicrobiales bacterium]